MSAFYPLTRIHAGLAQYAGAGAWEGCGRWGVEARRRRAVSHGDTHPQPTPIAPLRNTGHHAPASTTPATDASPHAQ